MGSSGHGLFKAAGSVVLSLIGGLKMVRSVKITEDIENEMKDGFQRFLIWLAIAVVVALNFSWE